MKITNYILETLYENNSVFKNIDRNLQIAFLNAVDDQQILNLNLVNETKLGQDFLKYLIKEKQLPIEQNFDDLLSFLKLSALLNKRKDIIEADLYLLIKINLTIDHWQRIVKNSLAKFFFKDISFYLDQNAIFKDQLTINFYNRNVSEHEIELTQEIIKWLVTNLELLEKNQHDFKEQRFLKNHFYQDEVYEFYQAQLNQLLNVMNFQLRAFKLIETY